MVVFFSYLDCLYDVESLAMVGGKVVDIRILDLTLGKPVSKKNQN